jgi:Domain of unknown function (DUF1736)
MTHECSSTGCNLKRVFMFRLGRQEENPFCALNLKKSSPTFYDIFRFDNPASVSAAPTRQLTYNYLVSVNLRLLLFPNDLCCDWTMGTIDLVKSIYDFRNLMTIFTYVMIVWLGWLAISCENRRKANVLVLVSTIMSLQ